MALIPLLFDKAKRHGRAYIMQVSGTVAQNGNVEVLLVPADGHRIIVGRLNLNSTAENLKLRLFSGSKGAQSGGIDVPKLHVNLEHKDRKLIEAISGATVTDEVEEIAFDIDGLSDNKGVTAPAAGGSNGVTCICPEDKVVRLLLENLDSAAKKLDFSFTAFAVPESDFYPNWYGD